MTFQTKMYIVFWVSMAMIFAASVIAMLNDRKVEGVSYWLIIAALPIFTASVPAFINQHTGIFWKSEESENKEDE